MTLVINSTALSVSFFEMFRDDYETTRVTSFGNYVFVTASEMEMLNITETLTCCKIPYAVLEDVLKIAGADL
ncbi:hypothetical protein ACFSFZ_05390 [Mixta tenebrionis]|uniref:Uncharacterized protein n=1 Tax=Mixta tenebrionis TaxID=2562439 RepID=A0A506V6Q4_9GAMM|nr:hypothetical protein [Mixta tenebrionis]TPW41236.1 hypothetical protein FKM52_15390 [Mixta tenebrionis]